MSFFLSDKRTTAMLCAIASLFSAGKLAAQEIEIPQNLMIATPCEAITLSSYPSDIKYIPSKVVDASEIQGRWIGGEFTDGEWKPSIIDLTCDGTNLPFEIEQQIVRFPIRSEMSAPVFQGMYEGEMLIGSITDDQSETHFYFPLSEKNNDQSLDFEQIYDAGVTSFSFFGTNESGETYYSNGISMQPLFNLRNGHFVLSDGRVLRTINDPFFPVKQIQLDSLDFQRESFSSIENITVERVENQSLDFEAYRYTTFLEQTKPVVIFDQAFMGIPVQQQKLLIFQILGAGYHVLYPTGLDIKGDEISKVENWNQKAINQAKLEYSLDKERILFVQWEGDEPKIDLNQVIGLCWFQDEAKAYANIPANINRLLRVVRTDRDSLSDDGHQMFLQVDTEDSFFETGKTIHKSLKSESVEINDSVIQTLISWARYCTPPDAKDLNLIPAEPILTNDDGTTYTLKPPVPTGQNDFQSQAEILRQD